MQKKLLSFVVILIVFLSFTDAFSQEPFEIRFSHVVAIDTPKGLMAEKFRQLVKERIGDDKVIVKIFPNSTLFSDSKVMEALLDGKVELAAPSISKVKKYTKRFQVFDLPFIFASEISAEKFMHGEFGERLLRLLGRKGFKGLGFINNGMRQLSANRELVHPEDLTGVRIRFSGSDVARTWLSTVGAVPEKISFSKLYDALKSNQVDGQMNTWSNIYSKKLYQQQQYIIESNHSYIGYTVISSKEFWSKLPENLRSKVEKALNDAIEFGNKIASEKRAKDKQLVVDSGVSTILPMTANQRQRWTEAMLPVWKQFEDEIGAELINAAASTR